MAKTTSKETAGQKRHQPCCSSSWLGFLLINASMVIIGVILASFMRNSGNVDEVQLKQNTGKVEFLGLKGAHLFDSLDTDRDGLINDQEFGPIVEKLTGEVG